MQLLIVRHAPAEELAGNHTSDADRELTSKGRRLFREFAERMMKPDHAPQLILHSPLVRARQTAETIAAEIGIDLVMVRVENALAPGIDTGALLKRLSEIRPERVLCVGHQPDMSRCSAEMIGGGFIQFSPGTIAGIEFNGPVIRHAGRLRWLASPRWFG